ncbi:hypothetical protein AWC27_05240 [Mycobacterium szulgai]|uniref:Geranylgeranyl pyrophosphate synthase n=1 Tax=Mycobacterium szulgai TaxID=1787 RepID=A0A1X2E8P6_MYCSZ|nr:polyprenyl synthetase family protein [Mycobacterium szulgai]MCV7079907.1 polyprenyl synthetase family protein [Mycobacterium szulgai]ORW96299.1 hypothetical protein AWC27_05240 [Mycobacterium szulgai]
MSVLGGVEFSDPQFAISVRDGITRIEELIRTELAQGDEVIRDAVPESLGTTDIRFRPLFTVLAAQFGPNPDAQQVTLAGAAVELMHLATLCHDTVVDRAPARLGTSKVRSANNVAILAGDYRFATVSRLGSWLGPRAFQTIAETFAELVTGQMRETRSAPMHIDRLEHYLQCVHEKTGSIVAAAGQLGATFSGAGEEQTARLARLGRLIGAAFQISEDIVTIASNSEHVAEVLTLLRSAAGMVQAKEAVGSYAAQARDEIACLPDCAARQTLSTLVDSTLLKIT